MNWDDVTVGIKTFYRRKKLRQCLEALNDMDADFSRVLIVDDGEIDEKKRNMYEEMKKYLSIDVVELPYNSGVGVGREEIVDRLDTDYLLYLDDDIIPLDISNAFELLKQEEDLGGVSGFWYENGNIKCGSHDFKIKDNYLCEVLKNKKMNVTDGIPWWGFDFISQMAIMLKKECLEDVSWDRNYQIGFDHMDFFLNHYLNTDWKFASTPTSFHIHNPGGTEEYMDNRFLQKNIVEGKEYLLDKFGLGGIVKYEDNFISDKGLRIYFESKVKRELPFFIVKYLERLRWYLRVKIKMR